jgi:DNA-binding transcriptional regulator of glucitol operon
LVDAEDELLNPSINLQAAWWVYVEGGWEQWSTYNRALEVLQ